MKQTSNLELQVILLDPAVQKTKSYKLNFEIEWALTESLQPVEPPMDIDIAVVAVVPIAVPAAVLIIIEVVAVAMDSTVSICIFILMVVFGWYWSNYP